jgi:uncharacterized protein YbaP (TraB family)
MIRPLRSRTLSRTARRDDGTRTRHAAPARARFARLLALVLPLLLAGCRHAPTPGTGSPPDTLAALLESEAPATPPFYRVAGQGGASLLLLGTIHVGPAEGWRLAPAIDAGIEDADAFVLEVDLRLATEDSVGTALAELVVLAPGESLPLLVAPETNRLLEREDATLERLGFPRGARDRRKPWYIAVALSEIVYAESGLSSEQSIERRVLDAVGDRPLVGLETFEEQLHFLDDLPPALADLVLRDTLARLDTAQDEIRELVSAWFRGDEQALARIAREGEEQLPGLDAYYDLLIDDRNARWLEKLRPILDDPARAEETVLVAVGALHLAGQKSLVRLLERAGYPVEAILR